MILLLLLPILVAGFIVITKHPACFYKLHRYDGQLLYLSTAYQGLICTLIAVVIVFLLNTYIPSHILVANKAIPMDIFGWLENLITPLNPSDQIAWFILISVTSILVAQIRIILFRIRAWIKYSGINWKKQNKSELSSKVLSEIALIRSILKDSPLDSMLYDSFVSSSPEKYLMLTMDDGKVYVGKVVSLGEPTESEGMDQEIVITPYLSGYRKKETLKVNFTTKYSEIDEDIALVLKQDKIISATVYNSKIYDEFQKHNHYRSKNNKTTFRQRLRSLKKNT
ncbi:MAG: hypothetical protein CMH23_13810 [Methylophaga sp.]|nr:hypothetical protein [Methylophaga sp.]|tara:strand:+ start:19262 stop:20107 length:846 start_codon:yes stop_codon:yes gene_type:complete